MPPRLPPCARSLLSPGPGCNWDALPLGPWLLSFRLFGGRLVAATNSGLSICLFFFFLSLFLFSMPAGFPVLPCLPLPLPS